MSIHIMIGGIRFRFDSDFQIIVEKSLSSFLCIDEKYSDISVKITCGEKRTDRPQVLMDGEDLLLEYYHQNNKIMCLAKGGKGGYLSTTTCNDTFTELECCLHIQPNESMRTIGNLLRLLPMCMILQKSNVLFFHASQIGVNKKGIIFTAPSGTGKTTQAKLWKKYRGAKLICNDRTAIRDGKTYGYPVDGSEPVLSGEVLPLGAIVLLEQGREDAVRKLNMKESLFKLFPQLIIDAWNQESRLLAIEQLVSLAEQYPVYLFRCTKENSAVDCLEQQLKIDGVI